MKYLVYLFIFILMTKLTKIILRKYKIKVKGNYGELRVTQKLKELPDEYKILNDLMFEHNDITSQIDHVVVSKYGIFVIETKDYTGIISGKEWDDTWLQKTDKTTHDIHNPIKQNYSHIKMLMNILKINNPEIFKSIIVMTNKCTTLIDSKTHVVHLNELNNTIINYQEKLLNQSEIEYISKYLESNNITNKVKRQKHNKNIKHNKREINNEHICPCCGNTLVLRSGKYGYFYGCDSYPLCNYTLNLK